MPRASSAPAKIEGPEWCAQYSISAVRGLTAASNWPLSAGVSAWIGPTSGASALTPDAPM